MSPVKSSRSFFHTDKRDDQLGDEKLSLAARTGLREAQLQFESRISVAARCVKVYIGRRRNSIELRLDSNW